MRLKSFKKFSLIIVAVWLLIVLAGLLYSHSFQNKIIRVLGEQIDNQLVAEVHIRKNDINFTFFKKFPLASVELRNVLIKVPEELDLRSLNPKHADTLLFAKKLYLQMNLRSLFKKEYELQKISVDNGFIQILKDRRGFSSLNILKPKEKSNSVRANINSFSLKDITVYTKDVKSKFQSQTLVHKAQIKGAFSESNFDISIKSDGQLKMLSLKKEHFQPMQNYNLDIAVEKHENIFRINKGLLKISNIPMRVIGTVKVQKNSYVDLVFSTQNVSLKQVDKSLLSGLIGKTGYVPKGGKLYLQSTIKGYIQKATPIINSNFTIKNGEIFDRDNKINYHDIYVSGKSNNGQNQHLAKSTIISVDSFRLKTGSSMQYGQLQIKNLSEPTIQVSLKGFMAINDLKKYTTISNVELISGRIKNDIRIEGEWNRTKPDSTKKKGKLTISGDFSVMNLLLNLEKYNLPNIEVNGDLSMQDNNTIRFDSLDCNSANSDITINGNLSNINSTVGIPQFVGSIHSKFIDINDFIHRGENKQKKEIALDFPDSISIKGKASIESFKFGNFQPGNVNSTISYRNKTLTFNNLSMSVFSGIVKGDVRFHQNASSDILLNANALLLDNNLEQMFAGFNNFGQTIISSEHLNGTLSGNINYSSSWSNNLKINLKSITSIGNILIQNGELKDYEPLLGLSRFINVEELKHIKFENLSTTISIRNKQVLLDQTQIKSSAISFEGSGIHNFNNKYEYRLQLSLSDVLWGKAKRKKTEITEFGYVVEDGAGNTIVPVIISGIGNKYDVKFDKRTSRSRFKEKLIQEKKDLKELFSKEPIIEDTTNTSTPEKTEEKKPVLEQTDSGTYRIKSNNLILDWDDE